jgi:hypothetical protein
MSNIGAPEKAFAQSEGNLLSSGGVSEYLKVLRSTGDVDLFVWEVCVWLPHRYTFC